MMRNKIPKTLTLLAGALATLPVAAQPANRPDYWHYGGDWGWGHMMFGGLMMALFWGGIILVIVLAVRWLSPGRPGPGEPHSSDQALAILKERFARGEIDREEFEERKRLLSE
jgi:putative membrane protein